VFEGAVVFEGEDVFEGEGVLIGDSIAASVTLQFDPKHVCSCFAGQQIVIARLLLEIRISCRFGGTFGQRDEKRSCSTLFAFFV
jgi:hypothetical protein